MLIPAALLLGGVSLLHTSARLGSLPTAARPDWLRLWPRLDATEYWNQTAVDPARAGEAAGVNLTVMVTIAGVAVALAGTLIELGADGAADIAGATTGVLRLVSVLSPVGGAVLLTISLLGRRTRGAFEVPSPVVKDGDVVEFVDWTERVVVLTRQGCHLCDEAVAQVAAVCAETGETYAVLDVDDDPELQRQYTDQVPVTFVDGAQHDFWRVDPVRLKAALLRTR